MNLLKAPNYIFFFIHIFRGETNKKVLWVIKLIHLEVVFLGAKRSPVRWVFRVQLWNGGTGCDSSSGLCPPASGQGSDKHRLFLTLQAHLHRHSRCTPLVLSPERTHAPLTVVLQHNITSIQWNLYSSLHGPFSLMSHWRKFLQHAD